MSTQGRVVEGVPGPGGEGEDLVTRSGVGSELTENPPKARLSILPPGSPLILKTTSCRKLFPSILQIRKLRLKGIR